MTRLLLQLPGSSIEALLPRVPVAGETVELGLLVAVVDHVVWHPGSHGPCLATVVLSPIVAWPLGPPGATESR